MAATTYAALLRQRYPFLKPSASVDHLVVGGGVLGLAVGAGLVNTAGAGRTTFVVERRGLLGQENTRETYASARNSEVIHSGIYYPVGSLKSLLCIRGRDLLYARAKALGIRHRKTGKLIVATDKYQIPYLDGLSSHTQHEAFSTGGPVSAMRPNSVIPAYFLDGREARELEPDLSPDVCAALYVTETGIVDSAGLVDSLAREVEEDDYLSSSPDPKVGVGLATDRPTERGEGVVVRGTRVVRIDPGEDGGWIVQLESGWGGTEKGEVEAVKADVVVDAAGLNAASLVNEILPEKERWEMWITKGNYMKYTGPGVASVQHLIYPCPSASLDSLGTHLTFDLDGNVRFGPDAEPLLPASASAENPDYWEELGHLAPSDANLASIAEAAQTYLPGIDPSKLTPDYAGFRPNIRPPGSGFFDFVVRHSPDRKGLVECLGFASPGLTSSLAAGEYVAALVGREVWGRGAGLEDSADGWEY